MDMCSILNGLLLDRDDAVLCRGVFRVVSWSMATLDVDDTGDVLIVL